MSQYSTTEILIGALLIWGIVMSAATWARFRHVGKPLSHSMSLLLSGGIWLAIFMILVSGDHYAGDTVSAGIFLVALACYAILRIDYTAGANQAEDMRRTGNQVSTSRFENGMLLSVSLGIFIFASQFSLSDSGGDYRMSLRPSSSELTADRIGRFLNATEENKAAHKQPVVRTPLLKPAASTSDSRSIRLEDGWNISLFHYVPSSDTVQIEAVTPQQSGNSIAGRSNTLKPALNNWHQISNVKVVAYPADSPATWIEVELSEDDINTLRFAAETGAISIYSE